MKLEITKVKGVTGVEPVTMGFAGLYSTAELNSHGPTLSRKGNCKVQAYCITVILLARMNARVIETLLKDLESPVLPLNYALDLLT